MELKDIIGLGIDAISVIVAIWSCIIAIRAKDVANNAINMINSINNGNQEGKNNISNQGINNGTIVGEQNVKN